MSDDGNSNATNTMKLEQFMEITGLDDRDFANAVLASMNYDVERAVEQHFSGGGIQNDANGEDDIAIIEHPNRSPSPEILVPEVAPRRPATYHSATHIVEQPSSSAIADRTRSHRTNRRDTHRQPSRQNRNQALIHEDDDSDMETRAFEYSPEDDDMIAESRQPEYSIPLIPKDYGTVYEAMNNFATVFDSRYGNGGISSKPAPNFFQGTLAEAVEEAFNLRGRSVGQRRPLAMYLHHDRGIAANIFPPNILCSDNVANLLNRQFVLWGWDITEQEHQAKLRVWMSHAFKDDIFGQAVELRARNKDLFPILLLFVQYKNKFKIAEFIYGTDINETVVQKLMVVHAADNIEFMELRFVAIIEVIRQVAREDLQILRLGNRFLFKHITQHYIKVKFFNGRNEVLDVTFFNANEALSTIFERAKTKFEPIGEHKLLLFPAGVDETQDRSVLCDKFFNGAREISVQPHIKMLRWKIFYFSLSHYKSNYLLTAGVMGSNCRDDPQMPQIGQIIEPHTVGAGRFRVLRVIYSGPFSDVFLLGKEKNLEEKFAMKVERQVGNIRPVLKLDVYVLRELNSQVGFPRFIGAGQTPYYKYCIMELLGPDLSKLRRSLDAKKFSTSTALQVCLQTLQRLETLHDHGLLCRDVKAPNFAIGLERAANIIYMLDFGFARKYRDKNGVLMKPRPAAALMGTFLYAPMASHNREEQCRRDDLESWFYMTWELLKGTLPWAHLYGVERHQMILEWKQFIRGPGRQDFLLGLPIQFDNILQTIDRIGFYERPDYRYLMAQVIFAAENIQVDLKEQLDWQQNKRIVRKAHWVGELGESNLASDLMMENSDLSTATDVTPIDVET